MTFLLFFILYSYQSYELDSNINQTIKHITQIIIQLYKQNLRSDQLFELIDNLGLSNFEIVFYDTNKTLIHDKKTNRAFKIYFYNSPDKFYNGDNIVKKFKHKNICTIFKIVDSTFKINFSTVYIKIIVMEYLPIKTDSINFYNFVNNKAVELKITEEREKFDLIIKPRIKIILKDVLEAFKYLHSMNYCMSYFEKFNIMLTYEENKLICKLIDFESVENIYLYNLKNYFITNQDSIFDEKLTLKHYNHENIFIGILIFSLISIFEKNHDVKFYYESKKMFIMNPEKFIVELNINSELKNFMIICFQPDKFKRPSAKELLQHSFFTS